MRATPPHPQRVFMQQRPPTPRIGYDRAPDARHHPCPRQSLTLTVVDRGSPRTRDPVHQRRWTRLLTAGVVSALLGSVVLGAIPVLFGSPLPMVYVYWRGIGTSERVAIEQQFRLSESTRVSEKAWSYVPLDTSPNTLRAIVTHPSIEDTDGINRRAFRLDRSPLTPRRGGWLEDGASVDGQGRPLSRVCTGEFGRYFSPVLGRDIAAIWTRVGDPATDQCSDPQPFEQTPGAAFGGACQITARCDGEVGRNCHCRLRLRRDRSVAVLDVHRIHQ